MYRFRLSLELAFVLVASVLPWRQASSEEQSYEDRMFLTMKPLCLADEVTSEGIDLRRDEYLLRQLYQVSIVLEWPSERSPDPKPGNGESTKGPHPLVIGKETTLESALDSLAKKYPALTWRLDREVVCVIPIESLKVRDYPPNQEIPVPAESLMSARDIVALLMKPLALVPLSMTDIEVSRFSLAKDDSQAAHWARIACLRKVRLPLGKVTGRQLLAELVRGIPGGGLHYKPYKDGTALLQLGTAGLYESVRKKIPPEPIPTLEQALAAAVAKQDKRELFASQEVLTEMQAKTKGLMPELTLVLKLDCSIAGYLCIRKEASEKGTMVPFKAEMAMDREKGESGWKLKSCQVGKQ